MEIRIFLLKGGVGEGSRRKYWLCTKLSLAFVGICDGFIGAGINAEVDKNAEADLPFVISSSLTPPCHLCHFPPLNQDRYLNPQWHLKFNKFHRTNNYYIEERMPSLNKPEECLNNTSQWIKTCMLSICTLQHRSPQLNLAPICCNNQPIIQRIVAVACLGKPVLKNSRLLHLLNSNSLPSSVTCCWCSAKAHLHFLKDVIKILLDTWIDLWDWIRVFDGIDIIFQISLLYWYKRASLL